MIRIKLPFQLKLYLVLFVLCAILLNVTTSWVNNLVSSRIIEANANQYEGLKTIFFNLLSFKIQSIKKESLILADQELLRQALEMLNDGKMIQSYLVQSFPGSMTREMVVVTDKNGNVIDGSIAIQGDQPQKTIKDIHEIQELVNQWPHIQDVLDGYERITYIPISINSSVSLFAVASVPVYNPGRNNDFIGTVTVGFPVDQSLAQDIRRGSNFHIGFLLGNQVVTSTFRSNLANEFRGSWDQIGIRQREALLDKAQIIEIAQERYLAYAAPLLTFGNERGLYIILSPMEDTFSWLNQLNRSIYWVSLISLLLILLVGYLLTRRVIAPITYLTQAVSRIADGDYSVDASVRTGDELEILGAEINKMSNTIQKREEEIKKYIKEIEEWNKELESKVLERTQDLEEKNFRLRLISEELGRAYARIDDELKIVGELQKRLLPKDSLDTNELSIRSFYLPNGRAGGDYYDYFTCDDQHLYILIADVAGHGTPAAFIMGFTRAMVHTIIQHCCSPAEILQKLSKTLTQTLRTGEFVTMFLGRLDLLTREFIYSTAGHQSPLIIRSIDNLIEEVPLNNGLPLGILSDQSYTDVSMVIHPGDRLFLYTDGIIEAFDEQKQIYGLNRLKEVIHDHIEYPIQDLITIIMQDLETFVQRPFEIEPLEDDVTLVFLDFHCVDNTISNVQAEHKPSTETY